MSHVGFGQADITPKPGSQSPGGLKIRRLEQIIDPLKVVAMVVRGSTDTLALIGVDTLFVTDEIVQPARRAIAARTQIPPSHVLIGASHTHSGGPTAGCFESEADPEYQAAVAQAIVNAVDQAAHALHDAEIGHARGHEPSISFNRRFLMRDGTHVTHPGKLNANIVAPVGPIDPAVGVLAARAPSGDLLGLFVHFACHPTISRGPGFSADYICDLRENLRAHYKLSDLPIGFLPGACGDVTQVDNLRAGSEFGPAWCSLVGKALAAEVIQAVARMTWSPDVRTAAAVRIIDIPLREPHDIDRPGPSLGLGSGEIAEEVFARERALVHAERQRNPLVSCEIQALRIGDLGIAANGAELFCALGLDIQSASPFAQTWVSTMSNQWIGYVPTASAYFAGGYEPRTARSSKLAPQAGQAIVATSLSLLGRLH